MRNESALPHNKCYQGTPRCLIKDVTFIGMMKEYKMSQKSKQELVKRLHPRYLQASRIEKGKIRLCCK